MNSVIGIKKYGLRMIKTKLRNKKLSNKFGTRTDFWNALQVKDNKTLFIVGSGSSIDNYSTKEWNEIRLGISVGLNYWTLHSFTPDVYCFEAAPNTINLPDNLHLRVNDYKNTNILIKDIDNISTKQTKQLINNIPIELRNNVFLSLDYDYPSDSIVQYENLLKKLSMFGFFNRQAFPVPRKIGSLQYITLLAANADIKNIVLCGVDLNNSKYFYDSNRTSLIDQGFSVPIHNNKAIHDTYNHSKFPFTIDQALLAIQNIVLEQKGIKIFVGKESSALYPDFPAYFS